MTVGSIVTLIRRISSFHMLKIWFDVLTPKQLLFFESLVERAGQTHKILFTSRKYREVTELARIRRLSPVYVGEHGGGGVASKLTASLRRASMLSRIVREFSPDVTVSFCSPEASRVSFGLGVPHLGFCNAPHSEAVCRLSIPLLTRLLIPAHIPKRAFTRYGLRSANIVQYQAMDEFLILNNRPAPSWDATSIGLSPDKKTIFFRTYETQASYVKHYTDMDAILEILATTFPDCNIVVFGRYMEQTRLLKRKRRKNTIVLDGVLDSGAALSRCDLFVGSGGTMTTEAVLRGIPTISYDAVPNYDEKYLVSKKVLVRAKTPARIARAARLLFSIDRGLFRANARRLLSEMSDPYNTFTAQLRAVSEERI